MHCVFSLINLNFESLDMFHIFMQGSSVFSFMCISEDELLFLICCRIGNNGKICKKRTLPKKFHSLKNFWSKLVSAWFWKPQNTNKQRPDLNIFVILSSSTRDICKVQAASSEIITEMCWENKQGQNTGLITHQLRLVGWD